MKQNNEQRASKRVPLALKVDWRSEGTFLFENATNISEHGIFIETPSPMKIGTVLDLEFSLPDSKAKIKTTGEVAWINPVRSKTQENLNPGMGIRFLNLSEVDRETILTLVKKIAVLD